MSAMYNNQEQHCGEEAKILDFPSEGGQTCHYQALSNIFRYYGDEIPEEFAFLLLRSFFNKEFAVSIPYFCPQPFEKIGYSLDSHYINTKNHFYVISGLINCRLPVIINVSGNKMPYFPKNTSLEFLEHLVIIYGYNAKQYLVSDVYVPYFPPEVVTSWVDQETLIKAIPKEAEQLVYVVRPESPKEFTIEDIYQMSIKRMLDILIEENEFRCRFIEAANISNLNIHPDNINQLAKKTRADLLSNGGPVETRKFLAKIFSHLGQNTGNNVEYGTYFANRSEDWKGIANACIKFAVIGEIEYFKKQIVYSYELALEEIEYMEQMKNFI